MQLILFGYNIVPLLVIFTGSIFLTIGDLVAKLWVQHDRMLYFGITLLLYLLGLVCLIYSFRFKNIAVASMMLIALNILTLTLCSWLIYGEPLNRVELGGLLLAFIALCLLEYGSHSGA